jgi:hypothetical protein
MRFIPILRLVISQYYQFQVYEEDGDLIFFILLVNYQIPRCGAKTQVSGFTYRAYFNSTQNLQLVFYVYLPNKKSFCIHSILNASE